MSAHVLLNLLNELKKGDKMQGLLSILSPFCNIFNNFNHNGAWLLCDFKIIFKVSKVAKIRNRYNQVPHIFQ